MQDPLDVLQASAQYMICQTQLFAKRQCYAIQKNALLLADLHACSVVAYIAQKSFRLIPIHRKSCKLCRDAQQDE